MQGPKVKKEEESTKGVFCSIAELFYESQRAKGATLHLRRKSTVIRTGQKRSSIRGRGMEFFESRPYVAQDEIRTIDWKVSARLNNLFTKVYVEEQSRPIYVVIDQKSSMFFGSVNCFKSVLAARLAARLAAAAINGGDYIGGLVFDDSHVHECQSGAGPKHLARLFGLLSVSTKRDMQKSAKVDFSTVWPPLLKRIAERVQAGSAVFLISDFLGFNEEMRHHLFRIRKKADVFALSVFDPLEEYLPALGPVGMAFFGEEVVFDSTNKQLRNAYHSWFKEQQKQLTTVFSSLAIPFLSFSTAEDLDVSARKIFLGRW